MDRYSKISQTSYNNKRAYKTVRYPEIPLSENDIYVISQAGDRFDILANEYYSDPTLWWVISISNQNLPQNSLSIPEGQQIRIPNNLSSILFNFENINNG
jgi:hypothetical protein